MQMKMMIGSDMTLDQATTTFNTLAVQGSIAAYQLGTVYNHVVQRRLAELAGYKTARDYFRQNVKTISQATLSLYGSVAAKFTEEACTQYGMYRLRALLSYAEASGIVLPADPGPLAIDVPQDDGKVVVKTLAECSVEEVERATGFKKAPPAERVPVPDQARLLFFEDSLFRNFNGLAPVRFTSSMEEGATLINLQGVPMTQVPRLIKALQEGLDAQPSLLAVVQ